MKKGILLVTLMLNGKIKYMTIEKLPIRIGSVNRKIYFTGKYIIVSYSSPDGSLIEYRGTTLLCLLYSLLCWVAETHKELLEVKK